MGEPSQPFDDRRGLCVGTEGDVQEHLDGVGDLAAGLVPATDALSGLEGSPELGLIEVQLAAEFADLGAGVCLELHGVP